MYSNVKQVCSASVIQAALLTDLLVLIAADHSDRAV
jgi:hypothetical protein